VELDHPVYRALHLYTRALSVALGYRDPYTRLHSDRVQALAEETGRRAGLDGDALAILRIGAAFHDIGKIGIRDRVLLKPAPLDDDESEEMRRHAEVGADIIRATGLDTADAVAGVIRHHHENWDGSGYPDGLAGEAIPVCSRIIGIADSYDAMSLTRAYHRARVHGEIVAILREESGRKHDPALLRIFLDVIETSPHRADG
jgi:putative nucleotidyltransferase with HDIG domain